MKLLDTILYDRQIRTYGLDACNKILSSSVLVINLSKGLGTEICKNLVLSGINTLYLYDNELINEEDLLTGYYYKNIGETRSIELKNKLIELNPNVNIISVDNYKQNQLVTIIINKENDYIHKVNDYTRFINNKLIVLFSSGLKGSIFVDANINHIINDINGEYHEPIQIKDIDNEGIVYTIEPHNLQSDDLIKLDNIEGLDNIILNKIYKIIVINRFTFKLLDFNYNFKFINGTVIYIKKEYNINHKKYYLDNNINLDNVNLDNEIEIMPIVSIFGSMVASETIKLISHKYMPINQWFTWEESSLIKNINRDNTCKTNYGKIFGKELENKLINSKWFLVGSGAIGCEHLKNLAYMNVKDIIITDPDIIEKSNLNRQFLFRDIHIGKFKSKIAGDIIKNMNNNINIISDIEKVDYNNIKYTDNIFNNNNITGVLNGLDNINARKFMDEQCYKYNIPLFECGTHGTKGNMQPIIPYLTETYSDSTDPDIEKTYPVCTIKSFPNDIKHTIHWALEQFEELNNFNSSLIIFNKLFNEEIIKLLELKPINFEESPGKLFWASGRKCPKPIYYDNNNKYHNIFIEISNKLINNNNIFDKDNELHIEWIYSVANIRANNYNIKNEEKYVVEGIVKKIIPAISTTTSIISGLSMLELLKYLLNLKLEDYKSSFINLVEPIIIQSEPQKSKSYKIGDKEINSWTKFIYNKNTILKELKEYYEKLFNINIIIITYNNIMLYSDFMTNKLNKLIGDLVNNNDKINIMLDKNIYFPDIIIKIN